MITPINFFSKTTLITLLDSHIEDNKICLSDYLYEKIYEIAFKKPKLGIFLLDDNYFKLDDSIEAISLCEYYSYPNIKEFLYHLNDIDYANSVYLIYSISIKPSSDSLLVKGKVVEDYHIYDNAVFKKHKLDRRNRIINNLLKTTPTAL